MTVVSVLVTRVVMERQRRLEAAKQEFNREIANAASSAT